MKWFIVTAFLFTAVVAAEEKSPREGRAFPRGMLYKAKMDRPVSPLFRKGSMEQSNLR